MKMFSLYLYVVGLDGFTVFPGSPLAVDTQTLINTNAHMHNILLLLAHSNKNIICFTLTTPSNIKKKRKRKEKKRIWKENSKYDQIIVQ